jgi:hypothetical protein
MTRWYVRLQPNPNHPLRFGEPRHAGLAWAVFPYRARNLYGDPIPTSSPVYFRHRDAALAYAHHGGRR